MLKSDSHETAPSEDFQALLNAAVDGIVVIDAQGRVLQFNAAAERLFGYTAQEVVGENVSILMADPDRSAHDHYIARYLETRVPHIIGRGREVEARRKDGSIFPVFLSVGAVNGENPPRFVGFVQDISYRRRAEEDTHRLQERLTHVSRLATVGEMSAGIAHELNQPLTAVANYAQACDRLLGMPDPDLPEIREALREITAQAVRAGDIIRRLRALARNDAIRHEPTDINVMVSELTDLVQLDAKAHDVNYTLALAERLPLADIDRAQVQQVIINLVRNAMEAFVEDGPKERKVTVSTRALADGEVEIAVCDNGPGVAASIAPRLFDPFCTTKSHGTGLGLAISRTIVKSHQGKLEYQPNVPNGSCFKVRLPLRARDES
ncbi:MAG TPA: PAS domain S-box protein [Steroidobacteraceae bacterium]|nr:PAS domain S-box protein [Steroidobacteraceae bacterium]